MSQQQTLGFLGPLGTHSEEVALYLNYERSPGDKWQLRPFDDISDAINAVANGEIERCVVPVENSIEGAVNITLDTLAHEVDLQIEREVIWKVHNQLMASDPTVPIITILSHAQPLAQCRKYLKKNYASAEIRQTSSTAKAASIVATQAGYAAIGTYRAGELYKLQTVAEEIQDNPDNCTRFFVLTHHKQRLVQGSDRTELICQINGIKAGSLYNVLSEFAARDVNLTRIESRPARTELGQYIFFFSIEGSNAEKNIKSAIDALKKNSLWIKNLGSFNVDQIDIKKIRKSGNKPW